MSFSPEQDQALRRVSQWLKDPFGAQVFRLFGFAGTGKTTLAKHVAADVKGNVVFCAYTGKAAMVLRDKGCEGAQTIHSLIYVPQSEGGEGGVPPFVLNRASRARSAALIILDECSMVDGEVGSDLLSLGAKVLVLGDPFQLPPVEGSGFFTTERPDVQLECVHRQAAESPVIRLSMEVRKGRAVRPGTFGESKVIARNELEQRSVVEADQVLIGTNVGRRDANARIRRILRLPSSGPTVGDRVVCLRNDRRLGLVNGGQYTVDRLQRGLGTGLDLHIRPEGGTVHDIIRVAVDEACFQDGEAPPMGPTARFDYGYAMTVHKAQGSQWGSVVLVHDFPARGEAARRWLYTGLTRASERVTVAI